MMKDSIGYCEVCGILEHHRVHGLCEICTKKSENYDPLKNNTELDNPLGVEAANVTTVNGFEKKELVHDSVY